MIMIMRWSFTHSLVRRYTVNGLISEQIIKIDSRGINQIRYHAEKKKHPNFWIIRNTNTTILLQMDFDGWQPQLLKKLKKKE